MDAHTWVRTLIEEEAAPPREETPVGQSPDKLVIHTVESDPFPTEFPHVGDIIEREHLRWFDVQGVPPLIFYNSVGTFFLGRKINVLSLTHLHGVGKYDHAHFPALNIPMRTIKWNQGTVGLEYAHCKALVYGAGKCVITGAHNSNDALYAAHCLVDFLRSLGIEGIDVHNYTPSNMVASTNVGGKIDLGGIWIRYNHLATYEPRNFPGLSIHNFVPGSKLVFNVFDTGRIVCTGAKDVDKILKEWARFYLEILAPFIQRPGYDRTTALGTNEVYDIVAPERVQVDITNDMKRADEGLLAIAKAILPSNVTAMIN